MRSYYHRAPIPSLACFFSRSRRAISRATLFMFFISTWSSGDLFEWEYSLKVVTTSSETKDSANQLWPTRPAGVKRSGAEFYHLRQQNRIFKYSYQNCYKTSDIVQLKGSANWTYKMNTFKIQSSCHVFNLEQRSRLTIKRQIWPARDMSWKTVFMLCSAVKSSHTIVREKGKLTPYAMLWSATR